VAAPDIPALTTQLQPYTDNPDFVDDQAQRLAGKRLGQQIYETAGVPKSLRAEAASVVAQALLKEENREGGRTWFKRAVDTDPTNPSAKSWLTILEGL
jgi:hypothetical protein